MRLDVLVAVPTYRRPGWAWELLTALADELSDVPASRVLVLDNDPAASGAPLAEHPLVREGRAALQHVGAGDVVSVRNAALAAAHLRRSAYLVLIDDDELPQPGWLLALTRVRTRYDADVVAGPVRQHSSVLARPHAAALLRRGERPDGPFRGDVGTGNVLVALRLVERAGLRFHPDLGRSGGEDTLFFRQAARAGARVCWAADAVVVERPDVSRLTRRAVLRRSVANGRASVAVDQALGRPASRARRAAVLAAAAAAHGPLAVLDLALGRRERAWRRAHKVARHLGRTAGPGGSGSYGGPDAEDVEGDRT